MIHTMLSSAWAWLKGEEKKLEHILAPLEKLKDDLEVFMDKSAGQARGKRATAISSINEAHALEAGVLRAEAVRGNLITLTSSPAE